MSAKNAKSSPACCECKKPFDNVFPVNADGKQWCPTCFHYVKAPTEPGRWHGLPVNCGRCGHETYSAGVRTACAACHYPSVTIAQRPID